MAPMLSYVNAKPAGLGLTAGAMAVFFAAAFRCIVAAEERPVVAYPLTGQIYSGMVDESDWEATGRSLPRGSVLLRREFPAREFGNRLIFEIHQPEFSGLLLRHPGMTHANALDPNPEPYFVPGPAPGPPALASVTEVPNGNILFSWSNPYAAPLLYLGFVWDVYLEKWVETGWDGTLWQPFWPPAVSGQALLGQAGGYFAWISSLYADGQWFPCLNPWAGVVYSGTPHTPQAVWVENRGSVNVRLHWRPEFFSTWFHEIVVFQVTSIDPFAGDFIPVNGPSGQGVWHFIDYSGGAFDPAKASFFEGWADFDLPAPGSYWFFIQSAGWLPPYDPPATGWPAAAFIALGP